MALTSIEQDLFDHAVRSLPSWFTNDARAMEDLAAMAKVMGAAFDTGDYWVFQTKITDAQGAVGDDPDWLAQHARDRDTDRQPGESDTDLRRRIRVIADALTRPLLLAEAQAILDEDGVVGGIAYMVELVRDGAYSVVRLADTGTGGVFTDESADWGADAVGFAPTVPFGSPPFRTIAEDVDHKMKFTGSLSAGNDGTYPIIGLDGAKAIYVNAAAVFQTDATVAWEVPRFDTEGNAITGWRAAYYSRGYRMNGQLPTIIIILPYTTLDVTVKKVEAMLRTKKAAGVIAIVERRESP